MRIPGFQLAREPRANPKSRAVALSTIGWGLVGLVAGRGWRGAPSRVRDNYRYMVRTVFVGMLYAAPAVAAWWITGSVALTATLGVPLGLRFFVRCS